MFERNVSKNPIRPVLLATLPFTANPCPMDRLRTSRLTCSRRAHDGRQMRLAQSPSDSRQNFPVCAFESHAHVSKLHVQHWSGRLLVTRARARAGAAQSRAGQGLLFCCGGVCGAAGGVPRQGGILSGPWGRATKGSPNRHVQRGLLAWTLTVFLGTDAASAKTQIGCRGNMQTKNTNKMGVWCCPSVTRQ